MSHYQSLKSNLFSDAPILAVTETYRRHPETLKIEALVLTCIVRVSITVYKIIISSIIISIIILILSIVIISMMIDTTISIITNILITSLYQAHPMASAKWSKGGSELDATRSSERQEIDRTVLEIVNPSQDDLGVYTCEASNSEGEVSEVLTNKENNLIPAAVASTEEEPKDLTDATEEDVGNAAEPLVNTKESSSTSITTSTTSLFLLVVMKSFASFHLN